MSKAISFILCSRNDNYMGNPVGRLEISLNYLAKNVQLLDKEESVEVIVTDWGSKVPLKDVLSLNAAAAKITRFVEVPAAVVKEVQKDSPFAEVLALNAAARRASGEYIGRIDQDTLVGRRFLELFFGCLDGRRNPGVDLGKTFLFSRRRQIPFAFADRNPSLDQVSQLISCCGSLLLVESHQHFLWSPVGIMLIHREIWEECRGYDERLLYWGWMEIDMAYRLQNNYPVVDLGKLVSNDFYHLEHYDPCQPRKTPRKMNPMISEGLKLAPNGIGWGLVQYQLSMQTYPGTKLENTGAMSRKSKSGSSSRFLVPATTFRVALACFRRPMENMASYLVKPVARAFRAIRQPSRYGEYCRRIVRF